MASVRIESICCIFDPGNQSATVIGSKHPPDYTFYNVLCIVSATVSVLGSIYQIFPRQAGTETLRNEETRVSTQRQYYIINWLAVADMMASLGILIRASVWLAGYTPHRNSSNEDPQHVFCAVSSGWIQFCYVCTYFWTFIYAVDVYRTVHIKPSCGPSYHIYGWIIPGCLCVMALLPYYTPSLNQCDSSWEYIIPHYLVTYAPMLLVMVGNPVLYYLAQREVQRTLRSRGLYTNQERAVLRGIQKRFFLVMLVFYICWLPNIMDGIMMIISSPKSHQFMFGLWHFMALVNPLQSFLNSLVYRDVGPCPCSNNSASNRSIIQASHGEIEESTEVSPLISFRRASPASSRLGSHSGQPNSNR